MRRSSPLSALAFLLILGLLVHGCASRDKAEEKAPPDAGTSATVGLPRVLAPGEVSDYHGQNLDPISSIPDVSIKGTVAVDIGSYRLAVDGLVRKSLSLSYEEVLAFPQAEKAITLHCVEGWTATALWSGPLLASIIDAAGPAKEADTVIFEAADGYRTSLPLADIRARDIILASRINGLVLPPVRGYPFMVAAESKWGYKWAKWVTRMTLSSESDFKGTWEEEGYNVNGDEAGPRNQPAPAPYIKGAE